MVKFILKKLVQYVVVLFCASVIIFGMVRLNKTDPVSVIVGGKQTTAETVANIKKDFNLDKSNIEQYGIWITGVFHGDFGTSFQYRQSVSELVGRRFPVTAGIVILATLIAIVIAIPTGILTAVKQNTPVDTTLSIIQLILVASPPFLTSILMIVFATIIAPGYAFTGSFHGFGEFLSRISLPAIALAFSMIALTSRVVKTSMIEQLQSNYKVVATAKGISNTKIIWKHCLKNTLIPVITIIGTQIGVLLVGSVLVEEVFSLAGLGSILIDGVKAADYPVVQAVTILMVFIFLTISTIMDILYAVIDPRIRAK
ncbi:MAG: ABC transporter permease [Clostridia bacterium]|nr:ABC transporter permease [Clostridia bacterium]NCC44369.1 ABC transporter permease [Clostridia bacterium]